MKRFVLALAALSLSALAPMARAQILIGQTTAMTGPAAAEVKDNITGAQLYFDAVNAGGGIDGEKIELVSMDDAGVPAKAAANARELIGERNVLAMFLTHGTLPTQAVQPLLKQYKVPLVAPASGAKALHWPVDPWVFNVRTACQPEAERAVDHLAGIGVTRIAMARSNDEYGADCADGALFGFDKAHLRLAFLQRFDPAHPDFSALTLGVGKLDTQAVIFIGPTAAVAAGIRQLRASGSKATVVTLSNNASPVFVHDAGDFARSTIVTQVLPYERSLSAPIVKEVYDLAQLKGISDVTPAMMEGFTGAKVLVEGLRRAGKSPTRQRLRDALEGINNLNIGGLELGYGPKDHTGLEYVDLSIIGPDGKFHR